MTMTNWLIDWSTHWLIDWLIIARLPKAFPTAMISMMPTSGTMTTPRPRFYITVVHTNSHTSSGCCNVALAHKIIKPMFAVLKLWLNSNRTLYRNYNWALTVKKYKILSYRRGSTRQWHTTLMVTGMEMTPFLFDSQNVYGWLPINVRQSLTVCLAPFLGLTSVGLSWFGKIRISFEKKAHLVQQDTPTNIL